MFILQILTLFSFVLNIHDTHDTVSSDEEADDDGIPEPQITDVDYVPLTTHSDAFGVDPLPISWGHPDASVRGPIICTVRHNAQKNAIGAHAGQYCIYTG